MDQKSFVKKLANGEVPPPFDQKYYSFFLPAVKVDHLLAISFSCGCRRFIEVGVRYQGPAFQYEGMSVMGSKFEFHWSYFYPKVQTGCGANVIEESWLRRNLKVFPISVGYTHGYFDHYFREMHKEAVSQMGVR